MYSLFTHARSYLIINTISLKSFILFSFYLYNRRNYKIPFGQWHVAININNICKGHFGSSGWGEASKNKPKDTSFIFPMTNVTILGVFRTHKQKEYSKVLQKKSTNIP